MDMMKTGQFLGALRKEKGLSQKAVAERLGVGDKAVSKWECGRGLPDIATLPALAELYEVTVDELLRGARMQKEQDAGNIPVASATQAKAYLENRGRQIYNLLYIVTGCLAAGALLLFLLLETTYNGPISCGVSLLCCAAGFILLAKCWREVAYMASNGAVMGCGAEFIKRKAGELRRFVRNVLFCGLFLAILNISLLITSMQYGGGLAWIDRASILHYWVAAVGAILGTVLFLRKTEDSGVLRL